MPSIPNNSIIKNHLKLCPIHRKKVPHKNLILTFKLLRLQKFKPKYHNLSQITTKTQMFFYWTPFNEIKSLLELPFSTAHNIIVQLFVQIVQQIHSLNFQKMLLQNKITRERISRFAIKRIFIIKRGWSENLPGQSWCRSCRGRTLACTGRGNEPNQAPWRPYLYQQHLYRAELKLSPWTWTMSN